MNRLSAAPVPASRMEVLITRDQITRRVAEMGREITRDFEGQSVMLVGVLKGATIFLAELARNIELDATFDFFGVSSYADRVRQSGEVRLTKDVDTSLEGRNVILVEDILDTGLTMNYLKNVVMTHQPRSFKIAVLLDKPAHRIQPIEVDYLGFTIPDVFVVGYGLDYAEHYRNLPDICILPPDAYSLG
ncbi:MAG TPA: hypoxanthine phosphoribosyltransferase [Terriglobales bacterium]|nr:hypoxanthine phosphoribosyltransferase [Terriglobales bacterium]